MRLRALLPVLALVIMVGASPAWSAQAALGPAGEIYRVRSSMVGDHSVLAFETLHTGSSNAELEVVPGTEDADIESNASLVFEETSGAAFVLWQKMASGAFPVLNLASRDASGWSDVIEIRGNPFAFKSTPQLLVTRDVSVSPDGATRQNRAVIHIAWVEDGGSGGYDAYYTPLILENGVYIQHNTVYRVANFDRSDATGGNVPSGLLRTLRLQPGTDSGSVVLVFADGDRARIASVEVRVLPRGLVALGDGARAHIVGADKKLDPKSLISLAAAARAYVLTTEMGLRPAVLKALADDVGEFVGAWKPADGGLDALGAAARAHIIGTGSDLGGSLGTVIGDAPSRGYALDEIAASSGGAAHVFRFTVRSSRPAPLVGEGSTFALFASAEGTKATVAWALADRVVYRESSGLGWGPARELALGNGMTSQAAFDMLAERSRNR